jgi:hypothetical protein
MATNGTSRRRAPRAVRVMLRLASGNDDAPRCASIEFSTPAGTALAPPSAPNADLTLLLKRAAELSSDLGFHCSYELVHGPDTVAAYVRTWPEKRAALDELRAQRAWQQTEADPGAHRADGTLKTDVDRANARAMMRRLSGICEALLRRDLGIDGMASEAGAR